MKLLLLCALLWAALISGWSMATGFRPTEPESVEDKFLQHFNAHRPGRGF